MQWQREDIDPQQRGRVFEQVIHDMFAEAEMSPRTSFRPKGEEIDGSFLFRGRPVLFEAKWLSKSVAASSVYQFKGKLDGKLIGTIGIFISMSGYSPDVMSSLASGKSLNVILLDGDDIKLLARSKAPSIEEALAYKIRAAAEEGIAFAPLRRLAKMHPSRPGRSLDLHPSFLSRILLNPSRLVTRQAMQNPHIMRSMLLPGVAASPRSERVLWRLDSTRLHQPALLVLTRTRPDWDHFVQQVGWPLGEENQLVVRDYSSMLSRVSNDREFRFRVTVNPVQAKVRPDVLSETQRKKLEEGWTRSFRVARRDAPDQLNWFLERASSWGFEVPEIRSKPEVLGLEEGEGSNKDVRIIGREVRKFRSFDSNSKVVISTATFEGRLRVSDSEVIRQKLISGLGPAKAFGCGLLILAGS
ncbi:type I-E CRISPR-associated protein Cas6/Cse3/CasE [Amycolatopsis sp. NPDC004079]|uniref:type I-E CRISPR-associated protein Cas6/Cse3/CasE n=1 Tax=Amycolatopsis sp. NPDC004079 TaxID=3154549 RepID=UPI00339EDF97